MNFSCTSLINKKIADPYYDVKKTATRNLEAYKTCLTADYDERWKTKYLRKKELLSRGFLSDRSKPYKEIGTVYLKSDEMILANITSDLKSQVRLEF